jgi:hypothetical protein
VTLGRERPPAQIERALYPRQHGRSAGSGCSMMTLAAAGGERDEIVVGPACVGVDTSPHAGGAPHCHDPRRSSAPPSLTLSSA